MAKAKANTSASLPEATPVPEGFRQISQERGILWDHEDMPVMMGTVKGPIQTVTVQTPQGPQDRRLFLCEEKETEEVYAIWESATLTPLFTELESLDDIHVSVFIRFDGYGQKKPGQNPPKLFTTAVAD
jgi:hypothetical protein